MAGKTPRTAGWVSALRDQLPEYNSEKHFRYAVIGGSVVAGLSILGVYYYWHLRRDQKVSGAAPPGQESPMSTANQLKIKGNESFKNCDYEAAIKFYSDAIVACPKEQSIDLAVFYQNRAAAHEKLSNWIDVVDDCTAALQFNNKYVKAILRRAKAREQLDDLEAALFDYTVGCYLDEFKNQADLASADRVLRALGQKKASVAFPQRDSDLPLSKTFVESYMTSFCEDPVWQIVRDESGEANNRWDEIKRIVRSHDYDALSDACTNLINIGTEEDTMLALLLRSTFWLLKGKHTKVLDDLAQVFSICDGLTTDLSKKVRVNALIKRASLHLQQGKKDEALSEFDVAETVDNQNADLYHHRAQIRILMDEFQLAKADFDRSVQLRPDFAMSTVQRCYAEYRLAMAERSYMQLEVAMKQFEATVDRFPNCLEGFAMLGQANAEQGNFVEAMQLFDKALALNPDNTNILVHKGIMQLQISQDKESAYAIIKQAIEIDPVNDFPYETLAKLESESGNFKEAIKYVDKAVEFTRTELDMANLFTLREAIVAQMKLSQQFGVSAPSLIGT